MPGEDAVTFERVTKVYREETARKTLTALEADFYDKVAVYIRRLEEGAQMEVHAAPNSTKALLLQDELRKVRKKREQILTYRGRKLVLLAAAKASGGEVDLPTLPNQERALFESLVGVLERTREAVFTGSAVSQGPGPSEPSSRPSEPARPAPRGEPSAVVRVVRSDETRRPAVAPSLKDHVVIHVLEDLPPFAGIDTTYHLKKEDVVTLPKTIAQILVDRGKARIVQVQEPR